jgi:hypothetical protein
MENINKWTCMTYLGAARELGVSIWRLRYAIESRYLPPPSVVLKRRALFSPDQVSAMRQYFEEEESHRTRMGSDGKNLDTTER